MLGSPGQMSLFRCLQPLPCSPHTCYMLRPTPQSIKPPLWCSGGSSPGLRVRAVPWMLSALCGPRNPYRVRLYRVPGRRSRSTAERRVPGTISSRWSRGRGCGSRVLGKGTPKRSRKESKAPSGASQFSRRELVVTSDTESWDRRGPRSPGPAGTGSVGSG